MAIKLIEADLKKLANKPKAEILIRFFKTGPGQYGEGDKFLGIVVPLQRLIAKKYRDLSLGDLQILIDSPYHEFRLTALFILTYKYPKADDKEKKKIVDFYFKNIKKINNWDLVDLSAPNILGHYYLDKNHDWIYKFARSKNLWERRIAILTTFTFIRNNDFKDIFKLAELLLKDEHDLIHKALGWMLREVGKRDQAALEKFLNLHVLKMPRTMLRYAIERLPEEWRLFYLKKK